MKECLQKIRSGLVMVMIQLLCSCLLIYELIHLGMIPDRLLVLLIGSLVLLLLILFIVEWKGKKLRIPVRVLFVVISGLFLFGSCYIDRTVSMVEEISENNRVKIDKVVVVVDGHDSADTLDDLKKNRFGVQYQLKGHEIEETVENISKELGAEISIREYQSLMEQISGLSKGEVRAIIFNEAYLDLLEEEFPELSLKVIYTRNVETKVEGKREIEDIRTEEESFLVYISGIDVYGSIKKTSRSDVNILAAVNPKTYQILLVNTPRDYYIEFPGITEGKKDKLTHAGIYGVQASMDALGGLYDIQPDFYARVNFTSLEKIVDILGGIDVYSEYAFTAFTGTDSFVKGMNHLNGAQALVFCRERHELPGGDSQRGKNQQAVLTAIIEKAISPAILKNAMKILDSVTGNVETNMSTQQIQRLVKSQLDDPQEWTISSVDAIGRDGKAECFSMPDRMLYVMYPDGHSVREIKEMIRNVMEGK